jgi:hypothetical protein
VLSKIDATNYNTQWTTPAAGDVSGPASATDNAIARFDLATGKLLQNSAATIDDSGSLTASGFVISGSHVYSGSTYFIGNGVGAVLSCASPGNIAFQPNGAGNGTNQAYLDTAGNFRSPGLISLNNVTAQGGVLVGASTVAIVAPSSSGGVYMRPLGAGVATEGRMDTAGNFIITGTTGQKASGTTWSNPSDARIKTVVGDYTAGLDAILGLTPRRFTYLGNETPLAPGVDPAFPDDPPSKEGQVAPYDTSPHHDLAVAGTECVGLVAQEAEVAMPDLVTQYTAYIDGVEVNDFRILDGSNVTWALVNAIKELTARIEALEAKG